MDYITREQAEAMVRDAVAKASAEAKADFDLRVQRAVTAALSTMKWPERPFKIFGLEGSAAYSAEVAKHLGVDLTPHTELYHEDGEAYCKSGTKDEDDIAVGNVRGHNVFVIQSLYSDAKESVADKFMKLCIMCGSLRDASAHDVTAVIPHLGWARQDRKTESRAPITTKYVAKMLQSLGVARVLMMDVHNLAAEQNAFDIPIDNLEAKKLFADACAEAIAKRNVTNPVKKLRILTPDSGGLNRCMRFRTSIIKSLSLHSIIIPDIDIAVYDKVRIKGVAKGGRIIGDVADAEVIPYDDMISTGGTMGQACKTAVREGGRILAVCATHGLFCGKANDVLSEINGTIMVMDTVDPFRLNADNRAKVHVVSTASIVAEAIRRIHSGTGSISELLT